MDNPLQPVLHRILSQHFGRIWTEYELINLLVSKNHIEKSSDRDNFELFQVHFLVMNALYRLQRELWQQKKWQLSISALEISVTNCADDSGNTDVYLQSVDSGLQEYYLNWDNFKSASARSVDQLLHGFWEKYLSQDDRVWALNIVGAQEPTDFIEIKGLYRKKAMQLHPDRGGNNESLSELNQALEILKKCYC